MNYKKKICLIGDFSVGKTSLVQRYVNQVFSEKYLTTIGVKIDTKELVIDEDTVKLVIWDVAGRDSLSELNTNYLVGAAGVMLVLDGTRRDTILAAESLMEIVFSKTKEIPFVVLVNKNDLEEEWEFRDQDRLRFEALNWDITETSAKNGYGVDDAFISLAKSVINQ